MQLFSNVQTMNEKRLHMKQSDYYNVLKLPSNKVQQTTQTEAESKIFELKLQQFRKN